MSHLTRPYLDRRHPVLATTGVVRGLPSLRGRRLWQAVRRALAAGCRRPGFRIVHFSVQGQHIHLLCEAKDRVALSRGLQGFKIRVARGVNRALGRTGAVFSDRYHHRVLRSPRQCRGALAYVLCNQGHHAHDQGATYPRGTIDPCSSAPVFDGWAMRNRRTWARPPDGSRTNHRALVAPPTTWLLRQGWRRGGGPLDPSYCPAGSG